MQPFLEKEFLPVADDGGGGGWREAYSKVKSIMGNSHMGPPVCGQIDTRLWNITFHALLCWR